MERDNRLDLLRVFAISMIVLMHSPRPDSAPGFLQCGISYLTASGLVLFFMLSGALLLGNNLSTKDFLRRRFSKIVFPTLFWTFFYLIVKYLGAQISLSDMCESIISIPLSAQGNGVLWFMYTLSGLYLLTPILSRWLKYASKREIEFYLLLWGVTLIYPYLGLWFRINDSNEGILYYFAGYVGYFVLGYYLIHYYKYRLWHIFVAAVIIIIVPLALYSCGKDFDFYSALWYLSLPVAMMAFVFFVMFMRLPNNKISFISMISKLSFGIYFVHIFIMRSFIWNLDPITKLPGIVQIPVIAFVTFVLSLFISWSISKLHFSKYIIGC